jgi:transposase
MGVKSGFALIDAGYLSEENILDLYKEKINFLSRLPSSRTLYKELIATEAKSIENKEYAIKYGTRGLFVKRIKIQFYGQEAYAFLVLDPIKKGKETQAMMLNYLVPERKLPHNKASSMFAA